MRRDPVNLQHSIIRTNHDSFRIKTMIDECNSFDQISSCVNSQSLWHSYSSPDYAAAGDLANIFGGLEKLAQSQRIP